MQATARVNLGMDNIAETVIEASRRAAAEVIQAAQQRVDRASLAVVSGRAVVKRGAVHSTISFLEHHRRMEEEAAQETADKDARAMERAVKKAEQDHHKAEKAASRELHRCRVCAVKVHRGGKAWSRCTCDAFWVCPACSKSIEAVLEMAAHIKECSGPVWVTCDSDCASEAPSSDYVPTE